MGLAMGAGDGEEGACYHLFCFFPRCAPQLQVMGCIVRRPLRALPLPISGSLLAPTLPLCAKIPRREPPPCGVCLACWRAGVAGPGLLPTGRPDHDTLTSTAVLLPTGVQSRRLGAPTVTTVSRAVMSTEGGETITLTGSDLSSGAGSGSDTVTASCINSAGAAFGPATCTYISNGGNQPATQVVCRTPAGLGTGIRWSVAVNGVSGALSDPLNTYGAPSLGSIR